MDQNGTDQKILVYERDVKIDDNSSLNRSIGNAVTQLYAIGDPKKFNLLSNLSALVPPQILAGVKDKYISDICSNNGGDNYCDYFTHYAPVVTIQNSGGQNVTYKVVAKASQHFIKSKPIDYITEMTIRVPYNSKYVIIEYTIHTFLDQSINAGHAIRPFPFIELTNKSYKEITFFNGCETKNEDLTQNTSGWKSKYIYYNATICSNGSLPWVALYNISDKQNFGNIGMILPLWQGKYKDDPVFYAYLEEEHPNEPNIYFQSSNASKFFNSTERFGKIVFVIYSESGYNPIRQYAEDLKISGI